VPVRCVHLHPCVRVSAQRESREVVMKAIFAVILIAGFAGLVAAVFYGATQVDAGAWTYAVVVLSTGLGVGTGGLMLGAGIARIVAARHPQPGKHVTMIDKAIITDSRQLPPPQF